MKDLFQSAKSWGHWALIQTYPMFVFLIVPAITCVALGQKNEEFLKAYALILQLAGSGLALSVIRANLRLFKSEGIRASIRGWWSRRPGNQSITVDFLKSGVTFTGHSPDVRQAVARSNEDTAEVQLEKLWLGQNQLWQTIDAYRRDAQLGQAEVTKAIQDVANTAEGRRSELADVVKTVAASSPVKAYLGVYMASFGTMLSSYIPELLRCGVC